MQCNSCNSYNEESATFCNQCGSRLEKSRRKRSHLVAKVLFALITLAAIVAVVLVAARPEQDRSRKEGDAMGDRSTPGPTEPSDQAADSKETDAVPPGSGQEAGPPPLDLDRATKAVLPALVVLDLRGEEDRPLREERGVLVDPSGVVLTRYKPLLGAHRGSCRLSAPRGSSVEILGVSCVDESLDLTLLYIEKSPTPYPAVPILSESPGQALRANEVVFAFTTDRGVEAAVSESYHVCSDRIARVRLAESPAVPWESFLVVDSFGSTIGLTKFEVEGRLVAAGKPPQGDYRVLVDFASLLSQSVSRDVALTLRELSRRRYDGTFADFLSRGLLAFREKRWKEAQEYLEQALDRVALDQPEEDEVAAASTNLRESYLAEAQRLLAGNRFEEAALLAQRAETRYPEDSAILVLFAEARYAQRSWRDGVQALTRARQTDTSERVEALLEEGYLRLAGEAAQQGDARGQEANLVLGVRELPSSASLHLELAKLYFKLGAYDDAAALLQKVKELSSSLRETADNLLARIDDALKRRDAVIIPIPQGSRSIRTEATVDGANALTFIVDTGATYTTIPSSLAEALGYDTSRATRVDIRTVAGPISAPLVTIQSLSVGGYTVRNLEVLVLPSGIGPEGGLLGLNFLKHFKYSVDASRSEFRLERP